MKNASLLCLAAALVLTCCARADSDDNPIEQAMEYAHSARKGNPKISDKIADGTATAAEIQRTLTLYKAMANCKPPKGDPAVFKERVLKLITATEAVAAKKPGAADAYVDAVSCKSCHNEFKPGRKK